MRGKPTKCSIIIISGRITPADAGKTATADSLRTKAEDHPRGCGENAVKRYTVRTGRGSPPRMRGKLLEFVVPESVLGITPADAGKTSTEAEKA